MKPDVSETTITSPKIETDNLLGKPHNVILFNDDHNDFLSVILTVILATSCSKEKAVEITMEAHTKGRAIAFTGHKEKCELVNSKLSAPPCRLTTSIESV